MIGGLPVRSQALHRDTPPVNVYVRSRQVSWLADRCFIRPSRNAKHFSDHGWIKASRLQLRGQLRHCRAYAKRTEFPLSLQTDMVR